MATKLNPSGVPARTHVPSFLGLADATVRAIEHDEFTVELGASADDSYYLKIESDTRHHTVGRVELVGNETPIQVLRLAATMIADAMVEDVSCRFRFHGVPIFAEGVL